jgi:trk system potassium uptake protein TrkH
VLSSVLLVGGPALTALLLSEQASSSELAVACGAAVALAGLAVARGSRWSFPLAASGVGLAFWVARTIFARAPDFTLMFCVAAGVISSALWTAAQAGNRASWTGTFATSGAAKTGAVCAIALWVALAIGESTYSSTSLAASSCCFGLATGLSWGWIARHWRERSRLALLPSCCWVLAVLAALGLFSRPTWALSAWAGGLGAAALFSRDEDSASGWAVVLEHPARLVVTTFAGICAVGTLVLALPISARAGHGIGMLDAMFTAASAACVTGLAVLDTGTVFSGFGQAVLLVLIQLGGLGIMTFYTLALRALGLRMGLRQELAVTEAALVDRQSSLYRSLGNVLALTAVCEIGGAIILSALFWSGGRELATALWQGLFTSVSAFCNAGFALEPDSLVGYQRQPAVLGVVGLLIVVGGLAPAVAFSTPAWLRGGLVSLQVRLVWLVTLALLAVGFAAFLAFEWTNTLSSLPWWHKLTNAAFQSATLRTAGFNSVDIGATLPATQQIMLALMFIGGSPGGTAGGIKTTTAALLLLAVVSALRGQAEVTVFEKRIVPASVYRAAAVATVGVLSVMSVVLALMLTQPLPPQVAMFEAVSALATVGLSTGGTALLDGIGKVIVAGAMFVGRVGPLTLFLLLGERHARSLWRFPDAEVDVG